MSLLAAHDVEIERGDRRLLTGVSLTVEAGDIWQLVGANGVGKTSLLRALAGLARLGVTGEIEHDQQRLYLGHAPSLKKTLSPLDNLRCHPACDIVVADDVIFSALASVSLAGYEDRPVGSLSAGQQRRVALARLLLSPAPLWLLDEPFTALDASGCDWLDAQIRSHVSGGGAVVYTSHQPSRFGSLQQDVDLACHVC